MLLEWDRSSPSELRRQKVSLEEDTMLRSGVMRLSARQTHRSSAITCAIFSPAVTLSSSGFQLTTVS